MGRVVLLLLIGERFLWGSGLGRLPNPLRHTYTILAVMFSWVLFRSANLRYAAAYFGAMIGIGGNATDGQTVYYLLEYWPEWIACLIAALPIKIWLQEKLAEKEHGPAALAREWFPKWAALCFLALSYLKLASGSFNPFIYFQF